MPVQDVVCHDDGGVYHQIERHGDACQRIELHFQLEDVIENHGHADVHRQAGYDEEEVAQPPRDEPDESQQDEHRQSRTPVNLVQLLADVFRGIITRMYLVAGRQDALQRFHLVHYLRGQAQLVGALLRRDGKINGVKPVDAVIALRGGFGMDHVHQFIQAEQLAIGGGHGNGRSVKARGAAFGHQGQANPAAARLVIAHVVCPQEFTAIVVLHGQGYVIHRDAQAPQLLAVILQLPLHGRGSGHLYLVHAVQAGQAGLDVLFGITLDEDGRGRRVEGEGQERTLRLFVGHLHLYHRIGNPAGQLGPSLAHDGGRLETHCIHIGVFVQVDGYAAPAVAGRRTDFLHPADAGQHGLQLAGHLHLHHTR